MRQNAAASEQHISQADIDGMGVPVAAESYGGRVKSELKVFFESYLEYTSSNFMADTICLMLTAIARVGPLPFFFPAISRCTVVFACRTGARSIQKLQQKLRRKKKPWS